MLTGKELTKKLAVLVPPPRVPSGSLPRTGRPEREAPREAAGREEGPEAMRGVAATDDAITGGNPRPPGPVTVPPASTESALLRRIFKLDVLACGRCGWRTKVIAVIEEQPVINKILGHLGLPHVPLPTAPFRGQQVFDFFAA